MYTTTIPCKFKNIFRTFSASNRKKYKPGELHVPNLDVLIRKQSALGQQDKCRPITDPGVILKIQEKE